MPIKYSLYQNPFTKDTTPDYYAKTKASGKKDLDRVIQQMMIQGSTLTEADIRATLHEAIRAIEILLADGQRVNLNGLVKLWPGISGSFKDDTDSFDKRRHTFTINADADAKLVKKVLNKAKLSKQTGAIPSPTLRQFVDTKAGPKQIVASLGGIGQLIGYRLKFNPEQEDEGIFFIHKETKAVTKVSAVQDNRPRQLVFLIPSELETEAEYWIEVRTRVGHSSELRAGRLDEAVPIQA